MTNKALTLARDYKDFSDRLYNSYNQAREKVKQLEKESHLRELEVSRAKHYSNQTPNPNTTVAIWV